MKSLPSNFTDLWYMEKVDIALVIMQWAKYNHLEMEYQGWVNYALESKELSASKMLYDVFEKIYLSTNIK